MPSQVIPFKPKRNAPQVRVLTTYGEATTTLSWPAMVAIRGSILLWRHTLFLSFYSGILSTLTYFLLVRSNGKTCETNRFGPMKFHYCDKVGQGLALVVVRRTGQAKTRASKRTLLQCRRSVKGFPLINPPHFLSFFDNLETPDTVPSNKEEIRIKSRKGGKDVMCSPKHNPENEEHGWCHTKVAFLIVAK